MHDDQDKEEKVKKTPMKVYSRFQLPSISVSLIDSSRAKEVIHLSVSEIDIRHYDGEKRTDTMANVAWLQVDNQLPSSSVSVILAPSQVKVHQPVIRLRISRNNTLSRQDITSYDAIEVIVQEIDLRLEQRIVLACWDLYRSLLSEVRATLASAHSDFSNDDFKPIIDSLGFSTSAASQSTNSYDLVASLNLLFRGDVFEKKSPNLSNGSDKLPTDKSYPQQMNEINRTIPSDGRLNAAFDSVGDDVNHTIYIEQLSIGPIKINMSFFTSHSIMSRSTSDDDSSGSISTTTEGLGIVSTIALFLRQVGEVALNLTSSISDAPIFFAGIFIDEYAIYDAI